MNPWVQGKPGRVRSHPPLKRIRDWLLGGPSHKAAVPGNIHQPDRMKTHNRTIRFCPCILCISFSFQQVSFYEHIFSVLLITFVSFMVKNISPIRYSPDKFRFSREKEKMRGDHFPNENVTS
jgi:hypothetical protein